MSREKKKELKNGNPETTEKNSYTVVFVWSVFSIRVFLLLFCQYRDGKGMDLI